MYWIRKGNTQVYHLSDRCSLVWQNPSAYKAVDKPPAGLRPCGMKGACTGGRA